MNAKGCSFSIFVIRFLFLGILSSIGSERSSFLSRTLHFCHISLSIFWSKSTPMALTLYLQSDLSVNGDLALSLRSQFKGNSEGILNIVS